MMENKITILMTIMTQALGLSARYHDKLGLDVRREVEGCKMTEGFGVYIVLNSLYEYGQLKERLTIGTIDTHKRI